MPRKIEFVDQEFAVLTYTLDSDSGLNKTAVAYQKVTSNHVNIFFNLVRKRKSV